MRRDLRDLALVVITAPVREERGARDIDYGIDHIELVLPLPV
jgi:hypothetical protein